jgi:hypothetical protein
MFMAEAGQTSAALGRYPAWLFEALALYGPFAREFSMMAREYENLSQVKPDVRLQLTR